MGRVEGYVEHIRFRNPDNGYTVLTLDMSDDEETLVGIFNYINEGEYIGANGEYVDHPVHGPQFQVSSYEILEPDDMEGMLRYLGFRGDQRNRSRSCKADREEISRGYFPDH